MADASPPDSAQPLFRVFLFCEFLRLSAGEKNFVPPNLRGFVLCDSKNLYGLHVWRGSVAGVFVGRVRHIGCVLSRTRTGGISRVIIVHEFDLCLLQWTCDSPNRGKAIKIIWVNYDTVRKTHSMMTHVLNGIFGA